MFDLDNTLVDRAGAVAAWASEFVAEHGLDDRARQWLIEIDGDGYTRRAEVFDAIAERFDLGAPAELLAAYRRRVIELIGLTPGAARCLRRLRSDGHLLVIVSNGSTSAQETKVDRLGLADLVDAVIVSETVGVAKPDRRIFELAAAAVGAPLAGASMAGGWMVGDSVENDIEGARAVGLRTAWLARGRSWDARFASPDVMVDDLGQLVDAIGR